MVLLGLESQEHHALPDSLAADVQLIGSEVWVGVTDRQAAQNRQFRRDSELRGRSRDTRPPRPQRKYPDRVRPTLTATFAGTSPRCERPLRRGPGAYRQCWRAARGKTPSCARLQHHVSLVLNANSHRPEDLSAQFATVVLE